MKQTAREDKIAEELTNDDEQKAWEKGKLGPDLKHSKKISLKEVQDYFGEKKGTSVCLPPSLIEHVQREASRPPACPWKPAPPRLAYRPLKSPPG